MIPLVLPREVGNRSAWLAIVWPSATPPSGLELRGGPTAVPVGDSWTPLLAQFEPVAALYQRMELTGLDPGSGYQLVLAESGSPVADCRLRTLPDSLPLAGARPLMLLTASCFSRERDAAGAFGRAFARLPEPYQPDLAILTGDQVYLDTPIAHFIFQLHSPGQLAVEFATNYSATFGQMLPDGGFGEFTTAVGAFMSGDDHELWNNAPSVAPHLPDTWFAGGRDAWMAQAFELFDAYQTPRRVHAFDVPPLSIRVMDTRFSRHADRGQFMDPAALADLADWLAALSGPGLVSVGQPILAAPTGIKGYFTDWTLADHAQYADLVRALAAVNHDVLVITGDVHYGRVAQVQLPNGRRIVELIASPMILVDDRAGRTWHEPPPIFPAWSIPGAVSAPVTVSQFRTIENHFATLALWAEGRSVRVEHTAWEIAAGGSLPRPNPGFSGRLN